MGFWKVDPEKSDFQADFILMQRSTLSSHSPMIILYKLLYQSLVKYRYKLYFHFIGPKMTGGAKLDFFKTS